MSNLCRIALGSELEAFEGTLDRLAATHSDLEALRSKLEPLQGTLDRLAATHSDLEAFEALGSDPEVRR